MTRHCIAGELSLRLADLQTLATTPQSAEDFVQLGHRVESCPCNSLSAVMMQALTLTDSLCWDSLKRGDTRAFDCQASISAELREFGVCPGLIEAVRGLRGQSPQCAIRVHVHPDGVKIYAQRSGV